MQDERRAGRKRQARRHAHPRLRPVDQRLAEPGRDQGRQGRAAAAGHVERARRRAIRLHRAQPADRVRDAQHPRSGRPLARGQHQPERRVPRMLHGRSGARGRQGFGEVLRELMSNHPKHLAVLNAAAEKGDWGKRLPAGVHRGIAQFMGYGSYSAATAEVSVSPDGKVKVHRMVLALNCGHAVNPDQIAAQVEGSVVYGLSAALYGEVTVEKGRMVELNFHNYRLLRLAEMPKVETVIVPSYDFWGGVGEPTICVVTPAVLNAAFAATGKPVRSLPLRSVRLV